MHRTHTRLLGLLLVVCLTALTAGTSANAFAVRRGGTRARARTSAPASHEKKWKAPNTAKLVRAVTHAHTVQARTKAVDNVLKGVGVGVYSGSGKRIVGGFERNAHDIYLYDFEVKLIVDQLADKTMGSFAQLATQFAKAGIKPAGRPIAVFTKTEDAGFDFEAMIPVAAAPSAAPVFEDGLRFGTTPSGKALRFAHRGSYEGIDSTYETLTAYLDAKDIVVQDKFVEEYVTNLKDGVDDTLDVNIYALLK